MTKTQFPMMPKAGGAIMPKLLGLLVLGAVLMLVIKDPVEAATWARGLFGFLGSVMDAIATFLRASVNH